MTDLSIDGKTFRVEVEGAADRPYVLLSNSLGTDLTLWDAQMAALVEHFRVIRYDSRGHGGSTVAGAPYSLAKLGGDVLAILDALGVEQTHFVGISMGGAVGQWLLVNAPERISRAVLANTNARFGTPDLWNARIVSVLANGMGSLAAGTMERWFSVGFRAAQAERVAAVESMFRATSPEGYAAACAALRDMDLRDALHAVARPVLIVTGRDDPIASADDISAMTSAIRGAQHVALDSKHISNIEAAAAFNAAVVAFLTARTPTRLVRPRAPRQHATTGRRPTTGRATSARSPLKTVARGAAAKPRARKPAAAAGTRAAKRTAATRKAAGGAPRSATTAKTATAGKSGSRKAPSKKAPSKKVPAKKVSSKRAPAKKVSSKRAPAKKVPSKIALAKRSIAAKKATSKKAVRKATTARRRPGKTPGRPGGRRKR